MKPAHADAELAARQLSLVTALVAGGTPPAGVDPERVRIQALALVRKRSRSVAQHRPELAASLGADFWPAFQRYAAAHPTPPANTSSDTKRFARYVHKSRRSRLMRLFPSGDFHLRARFGGSPSFFRSAAPGRLSLEGVLRLWDARTGSYAVFASSSVPLRVCVHGPAGGAWSGPGDVRVLLVADVLTRIAGLQGLQTVTVLAADSPLPDGLGEDLSALGIHRPAVAASRGDTGALLGGSAQVQVAADAPGSGEGGDGVLVSVGPVEDLTQRAAGGTRGDLLALRLALLSRPYRQPVTLTGAALADAAESAGRWRRRVAEWASQPSRPVPADAATAIRGAFDTDLNTVAAVDLLRSVESRQDIPAGAKFETFLFVDRVLGLELPREIGH